MECCYPQPHKRKQRWHPMKTNEKERLEIERVREHDGRLEPGGINGGCNNSTEWAGLKYHPALQNFKRCIHLLQLPIRFFKFVKGVSFNLALLSYSSVKLLMDPMGSKSIDQWSSMPCFFIPHMLKVIRNATRPPTARSNMFVCLLC